MAEDVYCTLLMSDSYLPGAAVLAHSLRDSGTTKKLAVLLTIDSLLAATIAELKQLYDYLIPVERLANPSLENLVRLDRLDLRFAFTKIALWRQERFRKIVYIDADVVALRAPDELFDIPAPFAAAPDVGWPDIFNSGVMLLTPNMSEYWSLHTLASSGTSFDGADQGLFNEYFGSRPWHRLSFTYNCTPNAGYQYEPAYRHFRSSINMVHFIGKDKPWTNGREALSSSGSGVYKELLGRWWAVYDRHYRLSQSSALGQVSPGIRTVQQYVRGDNIQTPSGWATGGQHMGQQPALQAGQQMGQQPALQATQQITGLRQPSITDGMSEARDMSREPPEASAVSTEPPMTEPEDVAESIDQDRIQPLPTVQQRKFSAPQMDWDATRSEPPLESKPEASNFPSQRYEMSHDPGLFHAPTSYPAPPPEAEYAIPKTPPKPKAIFPWEETAKKPTRVFADDNLPIQQPIPTSREIKPAVPAVTASPTSKNVPKDPLLSFSRINAWDEDTSIDGYVRAMKQAQARRGQVQVLHHQPTEIGTKDFATNISSPPIAHRRESLILTDFPTEVERPSLPVTPAPIHRTSFWGEERDDDGNLPVAEGVPDQVDWNPMERLEALRKASIVATGELPLSPQVALPERELPGSSQPQASSPPVPPSALAAGVPQDFSFGGSAQEAIGSAVSPPHVLSPTEVQSPTGAVSPTQQTGLKSIHDRSRDAGPMDEYSIA